jgi:hypothetical protein
MHPKLKALLGNFLPPASGLFSPQMSKDMATMHAYQTPRVPQAQEGPVCKYMQAQCASPTAGYAWEPFFFKCNRQKQKTMHI